MKTFTETIQTVQLFICIAISLLIEFTNIVIVFGIYLHLVINGLNSVTASTFSDCDTLCVCIVTFVYINVTKLDLCGSHVKISTANLKK